MIAYIRESFCWQIINLQSYIVFLKIKYTIDILIKFNKKGK